MEPSDKLVDCLFIHGWGMNHAVWQPVVEKLPVWINPVTCDLPGHGLRSSESFDSLDDLAIDIKNTCSELKSSGRKLVVVAWSLGALPCIQLLKTNPEIMDALIIVSSNPCFVNRENWQTAVDAEVFEQFAQSLEEDFSGTIRRFLSLQVKGSESGRAVLRGLREKILQQPQPNQLALDAGLKLLKEVDLRAELQALNIPVCWVLGEQDGLVDSELSEELKRLMPASEVHVYSKSGHAPFLSHTEEFVQQLIKFTQVL